MSDQTPPPPDGGRSGLTRAQALFVTLVALAFAALLDAEGLHATAASQPFGWQRDLAVTVTEGVLDVSRALHLTDPAEAVQTVEARRAPQTIELRRVVAAPVPTPTPRPTPQPVAGLDPGAPALGYPDLGPYGPVYVAGDSVSGLLGFALRDRIVEQQGSVEAEFRLSTGLTRPDTFDWPARIREAVGEFDPAAVVLMFGANDVNHMRADGRPLWFGTPEWGDEYARRVDAIMAELASRQVYWVGQPVMRSAELAEHMRMLNEIFRKRAAEHPHVSYVDAWSVFATADGAYSQFLPEAGGQLTKVRADDGIHLSHAGGRRLAAVVLHEMARRRT